MERNYVLLEDDVKSLSYNDQRIYEYFYKPIYENGVIKANELINFDKLLEKCYEDKIVYNPNNDYRYSQVLAKNIINVINIISDYRNKAFERKIVLKVSDLEPIINGLDNLSEFIAAKLCIKTYRDSIGSDELNALIPVVEKLKRLYVHDLNFSKAFYKEKTNHNPSLFNRGAKKQISKDEYLHYSRKDIKNFLMKLNEDTEENLDETNNFRR